MNEAVVLGVAQDGGHPQAGCEASCCAPAFADPSRGHRIACVGVRTPTEGWLLDATPDLRWQLHDLGRPCAGIVLTHAHLGHYTGLLQLGREAWAPRGLPVYAMPGMARFLEQTEPYRTILADGHIDLRRMRADEPVALAPGLTLTPWLVPHRGPWSETVGLHVQGASSSCLYLPDIDAFEPWGRDLAAVVQDVGRVWIDGTFFSAAELPHRDLGAIPHPLVTDTMTLLQSLPAAHRARVHFLHLNHSNPLLDPSSSAAGDVAERGFVLAREGDIWELGP